ncbi:glucokinase [Candidatus Liberibacter sp.]|uniref:glucokinase n=1 Tax=Candidatus Liberibacter sp. TaxID=34022 RepID=UPI0015F355C3|nr:glucokinase [Candidatus Liberibacter sp.]MBA5724306.1 glucokinase [Candidatus Liberibacter sp.]
MNDSNRRFPAVFPILIADIGGTNARFAILQDRDSDLEFYATVKISDFETLEHAIQETILDKVSIRLRSAFLAVAAPISRENIILTNYKWAIDPEILLSDMGFEDVLVINDFEAQALSIASLSDVDRFCIGCDIDNNSHIFSSRAIIGPGTGMGIAGLIRAKDLWIPIPGEGGHMDIGPRSERDFEIFPYLEERADGRISAEKLLSGRGLVNIYRAICKAQGIEKKNVFCAEDVISQTRDPISLETINLFCEYLGRISGDIALLFMSRGGIYLSGGIPYKILPLLRHSGFRDAFENKAPHKDLLCQIPTYVITNPYIAIMGMYSYIKETDKFSLLRDGKIGSLSVDGFLGT